MFQNGRVNTTENNNFLMYDMYKEQKQNMFVSEEAIKNIHTKNELSDLFFSRENIDILHDGIRYLVSKKTCGKFVIDRQSENDLIIVMRSIYLQYGEHKPLGLVEQVKELNTRVLEYCVPKIIEEIKIYMQYRNDISSLPVPLSRGEFVSSKGTKVLEQSF
jgi:hypothetical protein